MVNLPLKMVVFKYEDTVKAKRWSQHSWSRVVNFKKFPVDCIIGILFYIVYIFYLFCIIGMLYRCICKCLYFIPYMCHTGCSVMVKGTKSGDVRRKYHILIELARHRILFLLMHD